MCNCRLTESIIAIAVIVFGVIYAVYSYAWTQWVVVIAGIVLLIHSFACKSCAMPKGAVSAPARGRHAVRKKRA